MNKIFCEVDMVKGELVSNRRYLHKHPEVGFETANKEEYITKFLNSKKIEINTRNTSGFCLDSAKNAKKGFVNLMHNPKFDFDENALTVGVKMFCDLALKDNINKLTIK